MISEANGIKKNYRAGGFSMVELVVAAAIICLLTMLILPALGAMRERSQTAECATNLRKLGTAIHLYALDNNQSLPRSYHSAGANGEPGWAASITPYLGFEAPISSGEWQKVFNRYFRCPADTNSSAAFYSYALNVFFELDPDGDDYWGAPATWRRLNQIAKPSKTILLAEPRPAAYADHFMCHLWSGINAARNAVKHDRHNGKSHFLFVDGHVELLKIQDTFSNRTNNRWNPAAAGLN